MSGAGESISSTTAPSTSRIGSVDVLRGVIMVLMALDHTRDYIGDLSVNPTDLGTTTAALFLTRWVTHVCAPVFFLLTGTGAYLALRRRSRSELSHFLVTRGLWLVFLEVVVVRFAWQFNLDYRLTMLTVLWALGWAMVVLGLLVHLPTWAVTAFGVLLVVGHNLLDGVTAASFGVFAPLWSVLHSPGFLVNSERVVVFVAYPLIPWIGVSAIGFGLGQVYKWTAERRRTLLLRLGVALCVGFVLLRATNLYGDPSAWAARESALLTVLSFINTTKYPPSLLFLLMTLGPALLALRALDRPVPAALEPVRVIGSVPMFYYVMHIVLIHSLAVVLSFIRFGQAPWMFQSPTLGQFPVTQPPGWPLGLPAVYAAWLSVVVVLYPLCRWFADVKQRRRDWWLSYL